MQNIVFTANAISLSPFLFFIFYCLCISHYDKPNFYDFPIETCSAKRAHFSCAHCVLPYLLISFWRYSFVGIQYISYFGDIIVRQVNVFILVKEVFYVIEVIHIGVDRADTPIDENHH
jgi:hypothetical protein